MSTLREMVWGAAARLPFADRFAGARAVARREVVANLLSLRLLVVGLLLGLAIVGGSVGISATFSMMADFSGGQDPNYVFFPHAFETNASGNFSFGAVVFSSDAWGRPHAGFEVQLATMDMGPGGPRPGAGPAYQIVARSTTDADGFARFSNLTAGLYSVGYTPATGGFQAADTLYFDAFGAMPVSVAMRQFDLGQNGSNGDVLLHVAASGGTPLAGAEVLVNGSASATTDARGYAHLQLPPGSYNVTVRSGSNELTLFTYVSEAGPSPFDLGPDFILYAVATGFVPFIVPIATIAVAHDAIARERANGSIDFILSRPATRKGVLLGKFIGSTTALLVPVFATVTLGALAIGAISGSPVTGAFLGAILVAVTLYVASYTLLLLILSTLAKTTGTAIMFGVLLWVLYNVMWNIVVYFVTYLAGLSPSDPAYYSTQATIGLFNLNSLYSALVGTAYPGGGANPFEPTGVEVIPAWAPGLASVVWLVGLLALALYVFERRAAE